MLIPFGILSASGSAAGSYDLLETQILGSTQASVTFSSLGDYATDYKHLQIRMLTRSTRASNIDLLNFRFSGDTGSNYSHHELGGGGGGSTAYSGAATSTAFMTQGYTSGNTTAANSFGAHICDILDPFSTTKNKTIKSLGGYTGVTQYVTLFSGNHRNTAAITSIFIQTQIGSLVAGSRFSLYGIKG
jgi:hypothetical protein